MRWQDLPGDVLATVRAEALRGDVAKLGATVIAPDALVDSAVADGGADVILELVGVIDIFKKT